MVLVGAGVGTAVVGAGLGIVVVGIGVGSNRTHGGNA